MYVGIFIFKGKYIELALLREISFGGIRREGAARLMLG